MSINKVKFGDLFFYEGKSKIKAGDGLTTGEYPFYTSSNVLSKYLDEYLFEKTSLIFGTGGMASIHYCEVPFAVSTDCLVAYAKDQSICDPKFVYHYLSGNIHLLEEGFKGAGLKHISKGYINELEIPLPPLPIQKRIAEILDAADALKRKDQELLKKYDELAQAIFIDMFGDPVKNEKGWREVKLSEIVAEGKNKIRTGPFGSDLLHSEFTNSGITVLGIDNIVKNVFEHGKERYITENKYQQLKRYTVYPGDILITIMGTVGRAAVVPRDIGIAINTKHLVAITPNNELVDSHFLSYNLTNNPAILSQLKRKSRGAIMDGLNMGLIKDLNLLLPPIEMQKDFSKIFDILLLSKAKLESNLSEDLFKGLTQKAFNGELVA